MLSHREIKTVRFVEPRHRHRWRAGGTVERPSEPAHGVVPRHGCQLRRIGIVSLAGWLETVRWRGPYLYSAAAGV